MSIQRLIPNIKKTRNAILSVEDKLVVFITSGKNLKKRWNEGFDEVLRKPYANKLTEILKADSALEFNAEFPLKK